MKQLKSMAGIIGVIAALAFPVSLDADTVCYHYPWTTIIYVSGYGTVCGSYGMGCTECADDQTGDYCQANGNEPCHPTIEPLYPTP